VANFKATTNTALFMRIDPFGTNLLIKACYKENLNSVMHAVGIDVSKLVTDHINSSETARTVIHH
jgi:hypothetical protein